MMVFMIMKVLKVTRGGQIAALGERERAERPAGHVGQRVGGARPAAGGHRRAGDRVHQEHHGGRRARRSEGLARPGQGAERTAGPPVVGRDDESQPADPAERLQVVVWEGALAIDAGGLWCDALLGGLTDPVEDASNVGHEDPFDR
jgi:hypothetical protein